MQYRCLECGCLFQAKQPAKYCSQAHKQRKQNRRRQVYTCLNCGCKFQRAKRSDYVFCGNKCRCEYRQSHPQFDQRQFVISRMQAANTLRFSNKQAKAQANAICRGKTRLRWTQEALDAQLQRLGISVTDFGHRCYNKTLAQSPYVQVIASKQKTLDKRRRMYAKKKALGLIVTEKSTNQKVRQAIIKQRHGICQCCGYCQNVDALQLHHADMDRSHNNKANLVLLCANCHQILHTRIKRNWHMYTQPKVACILQQLQSMQAEVKERNKAGTADRQTRTEGTQECVSGATRSSTSSSDMNCQEAAPLQVTLQKCTLNTGVWTERPGAMG